MTTDKMRQEFEAWAKATGYDLSQTVDDKYWWAATSEAWRVWQSAYAAGRKAEREKLIQTIKDVSPSLIRVRGESAWATKMAFESLVALIENKPEGEQ